MTQEQDDQKKERVLHTRVPERLEEELKQRANELGTSVSHLVRNVLQNAFDMVGDIVQDAGRVARSARSGPEGPGDDDRFRVGTVVPASGGGGPAPAPQILGWQELVLALNAVCERCNAILPKGSRAAVAVYDRPGPRTFCCSDCLNALRGGDDDRGGE